MRGWRIILYNSVLETVILHFLDLQSFSLLHACHNKNRKLVLFFFIKIDSSRFKNSLDLLYTCVIIWVLLKQWTQGCSNKSCINSEVNDEYGFFNLRRIKRSDILENWSHPEIVALGIIKHFHFSNFAQKKEYFDVNHLIKSYQGSDNIE